MAGLNISRFPLHMKGSALMASFLKLLVVPAIVWVCCIALGISKPHLNEAVLISAMPIGALVSILASRYSICEEATAQSVVASFAVSVVAIPAWIYVLSKW